MGRPKNPGRRSSHFLLATVFFFAVIYLIAAYILAPTFWHLRLRGFELPNELLTTTRIGLQGDPINFGLIGTKAEVLASFNAAGWHPASPTTFLSSVEIGLSVLLHVSDPGAPVSTLLFQGRRFDFAFEQQSGASAGTRHHVRIWLVDQNDGEGALWIGAASFDRKSGVSRLTGQITHHIAPDLNAERDKLVNDLSGSGWVQEQFTIDDVAIKEGKNGGGDPYFTDGDLVVMILANTAD